MSGSGSDRRVSKRHAPMGRLISCATLCAVFAVVIGWWNRGDSNLVAEEGVGYALGIVGLGCMVALLLYSVRKRARGLRAAGRISTWFQIHMLLGLAGPVVILFHCNFQLGSLNSNVALMCALVVAASGVVGRVIYSRVHHGLSSRRRTLEDARSDVAQAQSALAGKDSLHELWDGLEKFEEEAIRPGRNSLEEAFSFLVLGHRCRRAERRALRLLRKADSGHPENAATRGDVQSSVGRYVAAVRRTGTLGMYERLFALWHIFHLPLTFSLYVSAAVHVLAVNMY